MDLGGDFDDLFHFLDCCKGNLGGVAQNHCSSVSSLDDSVGKPSTPASPTGFDSSSSDVFGSQNEKFMPRREAQIAQTTSTPASSTDFDSSLDDFFSNPASPTGFDSSSLDDTLGSLIEHSMPRREAQIAKTTSGVPNLSYPQCFFPRDNKCPKCKKNFYLGARLPSNHEDPAKTTNPVWLWVCCSGHEFSPCPYTQHRPGLMPWEPKSKGKLYLECTDCKICSIEDAIQTTDQYRGYTHKWKTNCRHNWMPGKLMSSKSSTQVQFPLKIALAKKYFIETDHAGHVRYMTKLAQSRLEDEMKPGIKLKAFFMPQDIRRKQKSESNVLAPVKSKEWPKIPVEVVTENEIEKGLWLCWCTKKIEKTQIKSEFTRIARNRNCKHLVIQKENRSVRCVQKEKRSMRCSSAGQSL